MNIRKIIQATIAFVLLTGLLIITTAQATEWSWCFTGEVTKVGVWPNEPRTDSRYQYLVMINCTKGAWRGEKVFYLDPALGETGYKRALKAKSLQRPVEIRVRGLNNYSVLDNIKLHATP